ncbi:calcineurin b [Anaeramoeba ignava]|uniref:Calcineurin b n=1 Tax=Anaeramoeba ignava TaxID=1746090 RepID=A0A9Q0L713_ANAIG|nr:calcineurin b [Anaeramoeba ignava]
MGNLCSKNIKKQNLQTDMKQKLVENEHQPTPIQKQEETESVVIVKKVIKPEEPEVKSEVLPEALTQKEIEDYSKRCKFTHDQIKALYEHYKKISASIDDDGVIDNDELNEALGLTQSEFGKRIFKVFDLNGDGVINFEEFLIGLSPFSSTGTLEDKIGFSFKVYDIDGNGGIDKSELTILLKACLSDTFLTQISEDELKQLIDATFEEADIDGNGEIDIDEYTEMVKNHPNILNNLQIDLPFLK